MVGTAIAAMGVDATAIGHETRIRIEIGRDGSTLQQSLPCQVVNLLGVGMVVTGDGDVFAWAIHTAGKSNIDSVFEDFLEVSSDD